MAATTIVWIVFVVLWAAVLIAALVQLARAGALAKRLSQRVSGYAELPAIAAAMKAEGDAQRINAALEAVEPLIARAQAALAIIREGPFPEPVRVAYARVRATVSDFNRYR